MRSRGIVARGAGILAAAGVSYAALRLLAARTRPGHAYLAGAPLLIAHRGGGDLAPENTLLAFRRAVEWWGADVLELDVHATRDGEVVVIHDDRVDRTTEGTGRVADLSLEEIGGLDAGHRFTPDGGESFPFRDRGLRIPTLAEVLDTLPGVRVNVEVKDARAQRPLEAVIRDRGAASRVLVAAASRANRSLLDAYPGPVSASEEEMRSFYMLHRLHLTGLYDATADAFQLPERHEGWQVVSERFVREAHAKNIAVHVWTINEVEDMRRLLEWGVDGVVTDRPDRLARVLHEARRRPRPPGPPDGDVEPFLEQLLRGWPRTSAARE